MCIRDRCDMDPVYPITALAKQPKKVKEEAKKRLVRITEHGEGAYVFCSEEVFESRIDRAIKDALYEAKLDAVIARGLADYEAGRFVGGAEAARAEIARRAESHG